MPPEIGYPPSNIIESIQGTIINTRIINILTCMLQHGVKFTTELWIFFPLSLLPMFGLTIVQSLVVEGARNAIQQITQYSADKG